VTLHREAERRLPGDWYPGVIPTNVVCDESAYVETTSCFRCYRSRAPVGLRLGRGASVYNGTTFDLGPEAVVLVGDFAMLTVVQIIADGLLSVGDHALVSWGVVLMDTFRVPVDPVRRRSLLRGVAELPDRQPRGGPQPRPIAIGPNSWIGFESCIMPGVTIGEGAVVGARSVVTTDVEPFAVVAGNPARFVRRLESPGKRRG
jgi:acetyltransferase-like isoleucine patch superfamily enzyme